MSTSGSKIDKVFAPREYARDDVDALAQSIVQFHDKIVREGCAYDASKTEKYEGIMLFVVEAFQRVFGELKYDNCIEQIVALSCKIAAHQAFPDGNKRTAIKTLASLLRKADKRFVLEAVFSEQEIEELVMKMTLTRSIEDEKAIAKKIIERLPC